MQGKQAKIVSPTQERAILGYLATTRYPSRDCVMFLLSMKAGLRARLMLDSGVLHTLYRI
jgi:integrase/recombinase XerD